MLNIVHYKTGGDTLCYNLTSNFPYYLFLLRTGTTNEHTYDWLGPKPFFYDLLYLPLSLQPQGLLGHSLQPLQL